MMKPSQTELTVLKTLWKHGPLSMRRLHEICNAELSWTLSSTRTTVARMVEKSMVEKSMVEKSMVSSDSPKDSSQTVASYSAAIEKVPTLFGLVKDFMHRILEIDSAIPVAAFTGSQVLSEDEIAQLERLLEEDRSKHRASRGKSDGEAS